MSALALSDSDFSGIGIQELFTEMIGNEGSAEEGRMGSRTISRSSSFSSSESEQSVPEGPGEITMTEEVAGRCMRRQSSTTSQRSMARSGNESFRAFRCYPSQFCNRTWNIFCGCCCQVGEPMAEAIGDITCCCVWAHVHQNADQVAGALNDNLGTGISGDAVETYAAFQLCGVCSLCFPNETEAYAEGVTGMCECVSSACGCSEIDCGDCVGCCGDLDCDDVDCGDCDVDCCGDIDCGDAAEGCGEILVGCGGLVGACCLAGCEVLGALAD